MVAVTLAPGASACGGGSDTALKAGLERMSNPICCRLTPTLPQEVSLTSLSLAVPTVPWPKSSGLGSAHNAGPAVTPRSGIRTFGRVGSAESTCIQPVRGPPPAGANLTVTSTDLPTSSEVGAFALRANSAAIGPSGS